MILDKVHVFVYFAIVKTISFYRTASGNCPVEEHLNNLTDAEATKIAWVLKLIREIDQIPSKYFKKLVNTKDIWKSGLMLEEIHFGCLVSCIIVN